MPRAKTTRGKLKTIRCPWCGKKFCTESNVLRHLNQPASLCFGKSLFEAPSPTEDIAMDDEQPCSPEEDKILDNAHQPLQVDGDDDSDLDMAYDPLNPSLDDQPFLGRFVEAFEGCAETFPGGKTFMDNFREDQYTEQRRENLSFPFASKVEWDFASWLLRSRLSMAAINLLLSLDIIKSASLSFHSAKELRTCAEILPVVHKGYVNQWRPNILLKSHHPLFEPHISFVPWKVWTSAVKICCVYDEWLSGDHAWSIQEVLPHGATVLGVILSSDKTNISVMSGNCMAHPLLRSLANIDIHIRSKTSLHAYLLLALLPIAKFTHKTTHVHSLLQDQLVHQALDIILAPPSLKTAAAVGIMMSDPIGNLPYCFTPLAAWIVDTPEESLLAATGPKASPITTAMSKNFGNAHRHPPCTATDMLSAICSACLQCLPTNYKDFIKVIRKLSLNSIIEPFWLDWALSAPCDFLTPEALHHFHCFFWDHNAKWCIQAVGASKLDFRFTLIQTLVGYCSFDKGISKLKQVTGRDHCAIQRYIIGTMAGSVPRRVLIALRALLDFCYLAQALVFTTESIDRVAAALQEFHDNKDAIVHHGLHNNWEIPKLELLQSVVPSISHSGAVMQWTADVTEHTHVEEIKMPARAGNNQNYYSQIARHLDRLDQCFCFDLATHIEEQIPSLGEDSTEDHEDHEPDAETHAFAEYSIPTYPPIDYFAMSSALLQGSNPHSPKPYCMFATTTTAFHLATKPSLQLTATEAAAKYGLPDLVLAISTFFAQ
ncbi:hypothetical protein OG21DRAFT_1527027 [Imleria badia]|nr:hypothetical protein OG21DRAFT_1527027 [Imleria badia]